MPGPNEPQGLGQSDTRLHSAWYMMWWRLYVKGPRDVLKGRDVLRTAKAHRSAVSRGMRR